MREEVAQTIYVHDAHHHQQGMMDMAAPRRLRRSVKFQGVVGGAEQRQSNPIRSTSSYSSSSSSSSSSTGGGKNIKSSSILNTINEDEEYESSLGTASTADTTASEGPASYHYSSDDEADTTDCCENENDDNFFSTDDSDYDCGEYYESRCDTNSHPSSSVVAVSRSSCNGGRVLSGLSDSFNSNSDDPDPQPQPSRQQSSATTTTSGEEEGGEEQENGNCCGIEENLLPPYPSHASSDQEKGIPPAAGGGGSTAAAAAAAALPQSQSHKQQRHRYLRHHHPHKQQRQRQHHNHHHHGHYHGHHHNKFHHNIQPLETASLLYLQTNLQLLQEEFGERHPYVARMWNHIGNAHFRICEYDLALQAYKESVNCELGSHLGDSYSNIGTVHWAMGEARNAIEFLQRARRVHEYYCYVNGTEPSDSLEIATVRYQIGLAYTLEGSYKKALKHLLTCRDTRISQQGNTTNHIDVARADDALGRVHMLRHDYNASLRWYEEALRIKHSQAEKEDDPSLPLSTMLNIASVHRLRGDIETAIMTYWNVLQIHEDLLSRTGADFRTHRKAITETLTIVGELLTELGEFQQAKEKYSKAMHFAVGAGLKKIDIDRLQSKLDEL